MFECQMMITNATAIPAWEQSLGSAPDGIENDKVKAIRQGVVHHVAGRRHRLKHIVVSIGLRMPFDPERAADDLTVFQALTETIERYYGALGMAPVRLRGQGILNHLASSIHPFIHPSELRRLDESWPLRSQLLARSPLTGPDRVIMGPEAGGMEARVFSALSYRPEIAVGALSSARVPTETSAGFQPWLISDHPLVISVKVEMVDQQALLVHMSKKQEFAVGQTRTAKGEDQTVTDASVLKNHFAQVVEDIHKGEFYTRTSTQAVLWSPVGQGAVEAEALRLAGRDVGVEFYQEDILAADMFLRSLPLGYNPGFPDEREMKRAFHVKAPYSGALLPLYGGYAGARRQHSSYLINSRGEGVTFDFFDFKPPHGLIIGRSRSGKSILMAWIVSNLLARLGSAFILDRYGSYNGLCDLYGGALHVVSPSEPVCFGLCDGALDIEHRSVITNTISELVIAQGDAPLSASDNAILTNLVQDWARKWLSSTSRPARLSDFAAYLLQTTEPDWTAFARRLALVLSMYYGDGQYAPFMDGENELHLGHGLTVLDVAGLENVPWLETIASILFFHRADVFIKNPEHLDIHKLLISDECSFTLRSEQAVDAIDKYVRAYARFNAGVVMITQNMTDLESKVGRVIINNAGRFILFKLLPAEAAFACQQLNMPAHIVDVMGRFFSPDEYDQVDCSEGLMFRPNDSAGDGGVFRLVAPPGFMQRLGTSRQHLREEAVA